MHNWHLLQRLRGYEVKIIETPWWAAAISWAWCIPVGRAQYDEQNEGYLVNSMGALSYDLFCWVFSITDRYERTLCRFAVTSKMAEAFGGNSSSKE